MQVELVRMSKFAGWLVPVTSLVRGVSRQFGCVNSQVHLTQVHLNYIYSFGKDGRNLRFAHQKTFLISCHWQKPLLVAEGICGESFFHHYFVHMLTDVLEALNNPCMSTFLWSMFLYTGLFAMMVMLFTLLLDFVGTRSYEHKQGMSCVIDEPLQEGGPNFIF